ncbi:MAG: S1 RNA-binding domain-containing protein [Candidatus Moranbacteria bacterium]|nr:S1 RNA-binding domain-containing protein [Candidatus Moranbacteria bacterium]
MKKGKKEPDLKLEEREEKVLMEDKEEAPTGILTEEEKSDMEDLLKDKLPVIPEEGTKIKGKVIEIDTHALFVDLGEMGVGIIYGKEVKDGFGSNRKKLKSGDEITASVIDQENEEGYVELSVREAIREEAWKDLNKKREAGKILMVKILDANKGGLMVEVNNITGFMPVSQLTAEHYPRVEDGDKNKIFEILKSYVNTEMKVCVIDAIYEEEKLIVSEKEAYKEEEKKNISEFKVGDVVEGEVSGVVDFGAFVKFFPPSRKDSKDDADKLEGLVHISQLDWKLIDNPRDVVSVGDKVKAKIISIDDTRISLSVRELKADPWSQVGEKYKTGDIVEGVVNKLNHFGAFVYLNQDIHGLSHISEFISRYPGKNIDEVIQTGETYLWQIMSMDPDKHRMGLKFIGEVKDKEKFTKEESSVTDEEKPVEEKEKAESKTQKKAVRVEKKEKKEEKEEAKK